MFCFLNQSCSKQDAPIVPADRELSEDELLRSRGPCRKVNLVNKFFYKSNIQFFLECVAWDKEFPDMYKAIKTISEQSWDHFFVPFGKEFFDNHERRDRLFKKIKDLDKKNGLDDLASVVTVLNETNFYDSINDLFNCAEAKDTCPQRTGNLLNKKEILDIINIVSVDPKFPGHLSKMIKVFTDAVARDSEDFKLEINKFNGDFLFKGLRIKLMDFAMGRYIEGISDQDRVFIAKLFFTKLKDEDKSWLDAWIKSEELTPEKFQNLVLYPIEENKNFIKDMMVISKGFEAGLRCDLQSTSLGIIIDEKEYVESFLRDLVSLGPGDFSKRILRDHALSVIAEPTCPDVRNLTRTISYIDGLEIRTEQHSLRFKKILNDLAHLLGEKTYYKLAQILANSGLNYTSTAPLYLLELLQGVIFQSGNELNKTIFEYSENYYSLLFKILKRIDSQFYPNLGALILISMDKKYEKSFYSLAKYWHFLNEEERGYLFRFIDEHFKKDVDYISLFHFYSEFLEELPGVYPVIASKLAGNLEKKEKTYLAIRDIAQHFSKKKVLDDFKKFFSRDYIIETIGRIANGINLGNRKLTEFDDTYIDNYVERVRQNPFEYIFSNSEIPINDILKCVKKITEEDLDFYMMARSFPKACKEASDNEITLKIFSWLHYLDKGFSDNIYGENSEEEGHFVDNDGFFSPASIGTSAMLLKRMDDLFSLGEKGGVEYFLDSLFKHFYVLENPLRDANGFYFEFEELLKIINNFNNVEMSMPLYRQSMIRKITEPENFSTLSDYFNYTGNLLSEYGHWYNQFGEIGSNFDVNEKQPEKFQCKNFHNSQIGTNPCPSANEIKRGFTKILQYLIRKNGNGIPTGIGLFLKSTIAGQGLYIPYEEKAQRQRLKRLSLLESFKMMYELSDREHAVNNKKIEFLPKGIRPFRSYRKSYLQPMTTMERVEVTIRDINFDMNYLGANYHNAVVRASDYNKTVSGRRKLFKACHGIGFCGKTFSRNEYRLAHNAIQSYEGLLDAHKVFGYGDYMQSLLQIFVGSSSKKSRRSNLINFSLGNISIKIPYIQTKKQMKKHNGFVLYEVSKLAAFSNAGRIIQDRVGRNRKQFDDFTKSKDFHLVSSELLQGYDTEESEEVGIKLLRNLLTVKNEDGELLYGKIIDYLSGLSYAKTKFVERTFSNFLVVLSYVGSPKSLQVDKNQKTESDLYFEKRYSKNSFYGFFKAINEFVLYWPIIEKSLPSRFNNESFDFIEFLKPINNFLAFFKNRISSEERLSKNVYYKFLNETFLGLNELLFFKTKTHDFGINYLMGLIGDLDLNSKFQLGARSVYAYLSELHSESSGNTFVEIGENTKKLATDSLIIMEPWRDYFFHTTREENCFKVPVDNCKENVHFDELAKFLNFSLTPHEKKEKTNLAVGFENIFILERKNLSEMLNNVLPHLRIVPISPAILQRE